MKKLSLFLVLYLLIMGQIFSQTRISVPQGENQLKLTSKSQNGFSANNSIGYFDIQLEQMFNKGYVEIVAEGYGSSFNIGNPDLPVINRLIEVPVGATVQVNVIGYEELTFNLSDYDINMPLMPAQEPVSKSADLENLVFKKNEKTYQTDEWFSNPIARYHDEGMMRGVRLGRLEISPFSYNPITGELMVINDLNIEVKFIKGDQAKTEQLKKQYYSPAFNGLFAGLFNYSNPAKNDVSLNSVPMHFVIISNRMFEETLAPFIEWKKKQGFIVTVRYTDEPAVGNTTTTIKNYLQGLYENPTPESPVPAFIALVGDVAQMPAFVGMAPPNAPHPTDLYYTTYDGPNDLIPEVFIGRMSAQTTAHLQSIISKTLMYEKFEMHDPSYLANSLTIAGYDANYAPTYGNGVLNYMSHFLNAAHGINPTAYMHPANGQQAGVLNALNNGVSIGVYTAHCSEDLWDSPRVNTTHINNLTNNGKYGLLIGNCCLSAKFDYGECFGEAVIRAVNKGGVGYIGGSESTYWDGDYWWVTGFGTVTVNPNPANFGIGSFRSIFKEMDEPAGMRSLTGSQMNVAGLLAVNQSSYQASMKQYYWEIYHFLGDPTLMPFMGPMPAMTPSYNAAMPLGLTSLSVSNLAPDSYVALTDNGVLKAAGFADADGNIELEFEPFALPCTADLVATTTFYRPFMGTVEVTPAEGAFVVPAGYTVVDGDILTYISNNTEIEVTLKNVGVESSAAATVTISCTNPQLTINNPTANIGNIAADGTTNVRFNVTVANDIADNTPFLVDVRVEENGKGRSWDGKLSLQAFAPDFKLEKVLVNGAENGMLEPGNLAVVTAIVANKGGADAFKVKGNLEMNSPYLILACADNIIQVGQPLPAGETIEIPFTVVVDAAMPYGHKANINLLLNAQYGRSYSEAFTVSSSVPSSTGYCTPGNTNCSSYDDGFTSVILAEINHEPDCNTNGYTDYSNMIAVLTPDVQSTIKVKTGYNGHRVTGWIDLNGNKIFDSNENLINITCTSANTEYSGTFTIPADTEPGMYRLRLRTKDGTPVPEACNSYSYGQTLDYTILIPNTLQGVQNVNAVLGGNDITITWEDTEGAMPIGYNIYRNGNMLNTNIIANKNFTEENIEDGIYAYNVTAVFDGGKESLPKISNIICNFQNLPQLCETPINLSVTQNNHAAVITWDEPENIDDELLGYNVYREGEIIKETAPDVREYIDETAEIEGTYVYNISAKYQYCVESELTEGKSITIVGINEITTDVFQLFPNPATNEVTLQGEGITQVEIFDITGRTLSSYRLISTSSHQTINVSNLASGVYLVKIFTRNNQTVTKRLVIAK